ncbi:MAG: hypothetical protein AAF466_02525 [Bacteroidota bacterium]
MEIKQHNQVVFYQKIGELFYAMAAVDNVVRVKEYEALKNLVLTEWTSIDEYKDEFDTDAVFQMEIVFEWFEYEDMDAEQCFDDFKEFYKEHPSLFTQKRKDLIWRTVNAIANAFAGTNKAELIMLTQLHLLMQDKA